MKIFTSNFNCFLNKTSCDEAKKHLKPFKNFLDKDVLAICDTRREIDGNLLIPMERSRQMRYNLYDVLNEEAKFTVEYSRKFHMFALMNHLNEFRFDHAMLYVKNLCEHVNDCEKILIKLLDFFIQAMRDSDKELLLRNVREIARFSVELQQYFLHRKKSMNSVCIVFNFFQYCWFHQNAELLYAFCTELDALNFTTSKESKKQFIEFVKSYLTDKCTVAHICIWDKKLRFFEKLFNHFGFNMKESSLLCDADEKICDILFEAAFQIAHVNSIKKCEVFFMLLKFPGMRDYYRDNPNDEIELQAWLLIFSPNALPYFRMKYFGLFADFLSINKPHLFHRELLHAFVDDEFSFRDILGESTETSEESEME